MSDGQAEPTNGSKARFLQSMNDNECMPPEIEDAFLNFIIDSSRAQCEGVGDSVSGAEFDMALNGFSTIFNSNQCWSSLCAESSHPSDLFFKILFAEAARCAGVTDPNAIIPQCVLSQIFSVIFSSEEGSEVSRIRRALQESSSCEQPNAIELGYFVTFLLTEAESACSENENNANIDLDFGAVFDTLVTIFGASQCWGVDECSDAGTTYNDDWFMPVVKMEGTRCEGPSADISSTRAIELSYFYLVETPAISEEVMVETIKGIERSFISHACSMERRRSLEDVGSSFEPDIRAIDSNPLDVISADCELICYVFVCLEVVANLT